MALQEVEAIGLVVKQDGKAVEGLRKASGLQGSADCVTEVDLGVSDLVELVSLFTEA